MRKFLQSRLAILLLGAILVSIGIPYAVRSGREVMNSYRSMQFARQHNFDAGNLDVELISPWMNMRYIAEAYAVPQSFIFDEIGVEMKRSASELPLGRLNQRHRFGDSESGGPVLVDYVRKAITTYHADPVVTGLSEGRVRGWMNVTYIANSTGISVKTFFDALGLPVEGHAYMPLPRLVEMAGYQPGLDQLIQVLEETIDSNGGVR